MLSAMTVTAQSERAARAPLSRQQVLRAALDYVDQHGLEALSMHKLGAELGVKAMSLYKHVADKDDILDGIVELLWDEIPTEPAAGDWREAIRPHAATLLYSRQEIRERPLRLAHGALRLMRKDGVPEECAVALLRTVFPYGIGYALAELSLPPPPPPGPDSEIALIRQVSGMLSPQAPDDLVRTALLVCGDCDMTAQFRIGVDLMIHGLDAYLATLGLEEDAAARCS